MKKLLGRDTGSIKTHTLDIASKPSGAHELQGSERLVDAVAQTCGHRRILVNYTDITRPLP